MIVVNLTFNETPPQNQILKQYFDHIYDAYTAVNDDGVNVSDGDIVSSIPDIGKTGGKPMTYKGTMTPLLTGLPPKYRHQLGGYIQFNNQFNTPYVTSQFTEEMPFPRELFFVGNQAMFNIFEALWNDFHSHPIADAGDNAIRFRASIDEPPSGQPNTISVGFPTLQNYLLHVKYIEDEIGIRCEVRINKTLINETVYTIDTSRIGMPTFSLGADTNSSNYGACWQGWSFSAISDQQRAIIENNLYTRYNIGTRINLPVAKSLGALKSGTQYSCSYTYENPLGIAENVAMRSVRWVITINGSIQTGKYMTTVDGLMTWSSVAFPIEDGYAVSTVEVICVDISGNRYLVPEKSFVTT